MNDPNRPGEAEQAEQQRRIQAIRDHKRTTGKTSLTHAEITAVIGDNRGGNPHLYPDGYDPADSKIQGIRNRTGTTKANNGGIIGVSVTERYPNRFFAATYNSDGVQKFRRFRCAMDAVETRNQWAEEDHPGQPEFQCGVREAFEKWGCSCGRHVHPEHGHTSRAGEQSETGVRQSKNEQARHRRQGSEKG